MTKNAVWILAGLACVLGVAGIALQITAQSEKASYGAYADALKLYHEGRALLEADRPGAAGAKFAQLTARIDAQKGNTDWQTLRPYALQAEALSAFMVSQQQWTRVVTVYAKNTDEPLPDAKEILKGYERLQSAYAALAAKDPFTEPETAWWLENDAATGIVWQLITRWAMLEAKFDELKPLYNAALDRYKKAMPLAEAAGHEPSRYVSQNLDFMTRLGEAMQQQQPQPQPQQSKPKEGEQEGNEQGQPAGAQRKGLGDFLSKAMAQAKQGQGKPQGMGMMLAGNTPDIGKKFLPLPQKGIGTNRLPVAGTK